MISIWKSLIVLLIACLILVVPSNVSSINQSFIGVVNEDTFTYVVDQYYSSRRYDYGYPVGYDDATDQHIYTSKGDTFTITIENIIVNRQYNSEIERLDYEVDYENQFFTESVYFDHNFGRIMTSTDWENQKSSLDGQWNIQNVGARFILDEWELINTESEFGMKINYSFDSEDKIELIKAEIKYQKTTGMLSYESVDIENSGDISKLEYVVKLISDDDQELILPGFEWFYIYAAFPVIILRKQRYKIQR